MLAQIGASCQAGILQLYLNQVYFGKGPTGHPRPAIFGKEVSDLKLAECALLAGIRAPATPLLPAGPPAGGATVLDHAAEGFINENEKKGGPQSGVPLAKPST